MLYYTSNYVCTRARGMQSVWLKNRGFRPWFQTLVLVSDLGFRPPPTKPVIKIWKSTLTLPPGAAPDPPLSHPHIPPRWVWDGEEEGWEEKAGYEFPHQGGS